MLFVRTLDDSESEVVSDNTEATKIDDDDDSASRTGTELLIKTPEKVEKSEEMGTEFLLGDADREVPDDKETVASSAVGTTRRRKSHVDADAEQLDATGWEMNDITADAMSIQPTGYTLETAHVRLRLLYNTIGRQR